ncbi:MAG: ankyrin repeat domain-containing protein, partial [Candidatus Azotimanducaceae bacterium]
LLKRGAVIDDRDQLELGKQLCTRAAEGHLDGVRHLLDCQASVNAVMYDLRTALHLSASEGHEHVVQFLLKNKADPMLTDRWGGTPLQDAVRGGHSSCAQTLRDAGAVDPNSAVAGLQAEGGDGSEGRPPMTRGRTQSTLDFEKLTTFSDGEVLCKAAASGVVSNIRKVLETGADVNSCDYDRRSGLHVACAEGHLDAVKLLVEKGANVNCEDRWGGRPLHDAQRRANNAELVSFLISAGALPPEKKHNDSSDQGYGDRLCKAAARGDMALIEDLLQRGASVNASDYDGRSPLHLAAAEGHGDVVRFLIANDVDINKKDRWGGTALKDAVRGGHKEVESLLKDNGATHGYTDYSEEQAIGENLCKAAARGDLNQIRNLVAKGASVDAHDYDRRSALHLAAAEGHEKVVDYLLRHKANVQATDRFGANALMDAIRGRHSNVQQILFLAGASEGASLEQAHADAVEKVRRPRFCSLATTPASPPQHLPPLLLFPHRIDMRGGDTAQRGGADLPGSPEQEYQKQPLHLRAKAERWIVDRSEIRLGNLIGEGQQGQVLKADW